ncbi:UNVERIFIED_CONTAM: hypothetical protein K2H54_044223, partial [Gekko kuhli]
IDLAFIENGYIYHTKYDTADRILTDSIQRAGDNILGVLKYLAKSDNLAKSYEYRHGNVVFFDILGMFVLAYPARVGAILNYVITALAVLYLGKKILQPRKRVPCAAQEAEDPPMFWRALAAVERKPLEDLVAALEFSVNYLKELAIAFFIIVLGWLTTLLGILIVAVFISLIGRSLSWYTHFYVSIFLYGTATLAKLIFVHSWIKKSHYKNTNEQFLGEVFFDVSLVFWSIMLALFTYLGFCSAFVSAIWVAFPLLTKLMTYKEFKEKGATMKFLLIYLLGMFVPCLYVMYLSWIAYEMVIPIMGRTGSEVPPDVLVASSVVVSSIVLSSYFLNFIYIARSTKKTVLTLTTVFAVAFILVCSGVFFPYSSDLTNPRPKRIFLQHLSRRFHELNGHLAKSDSGIWINGLDYGGMSHVTPHIPELNDTIRTKCEEESPFCGLPWILPVNHLFRKNWYLPAPVLIPKASIQFQLLSREQMPWDATKLTFEISGEISAHAFSLWIITFQ